MKTILALILCLSALRMTAQKETFDIASYEAPAGWKKQITDYAVSFSSVDNVTRAWCQIAIYKSVNGGTDAKGNFSSEWKALAKPESYPGATQPIPVLSLKDGWSLARGTSSFKWEGKDAQVALSTASGNGVVLSAIASTNSSKHAADIDKFFQSIKLKPLAAPLQSAPVTAVSVPQATPGTQGILTATTNFDDGWVAQPFADYVRVTRNGITVLLHYSIAIDDEMRQAPNMAANVWNRIIAPRYRGGQVTTLQNEGYTYFKVWFAEASVTDAATGIPVHVALRVLVENGIATPIEIISPTAAAFQAAFPDQEKIAALTGYNKFAVAAGDIVGTWDESSSSSLAYYNTVTGGYAGSSTAASANSFTFLADGSYSSHHSGAMGMTGNMKFYDQKYNGMYTIAPWESTMTKRFEGKTDVFYWQYQAVRGGRVLMMTNKQYSGTRYSLVKVR